MSHRFPPPNMRFPPPIPNAFQSHIPALPPPFFSSAPPPCIPPRQSPPEPETDEVWINNFLRRTGKDVAAANRLPKVKIRDAVEAIDAYASELQKLKELEHDMAAIIDTVTDEEWKPKWEAVKALQSALAVQFRRLPDGDALPALKMALARRRKRRERARRRRKLLSQEAVTRRLSNQRRTARVEAEQRKEADGAEAARAAAQVAAQAALVLADTSRRQHDARSQLSTLSALLRLRMLRATATGGDPAQASEAFGAAVHALIGAWTARQRQYDVEEVGLRLMLGHDGTEDVTQKRPATAQWRRVLFGGPRRADRQYVAANQSLDAFVSVRRDWDQFVVDPAAPMSSCVPIGWVIPAPPSSPSWAELLVDKP